MIKILLSCVLISAPSFIFSQTTLALQPGPAEGKDAKIFNIGASANYGDDIEFIASTLLYAGEPGTQRSMIAFDLSSIPSDAGIVDARLSLYYNDATETEGQSGSNATFLRRITSDWEESTVDWTNQPFYTNTNQVLLPKSTNPQQDYIDIDVAPLVRDMIQNPNNSFGFMLMGEAEDQVGSLKFFSSDATDAARRPKLIVTYISDPVNCIVNLPGAGGTDANLFSLATESNYGNDESLLATAWTFDEVNGIIRSIIDFDLSALPSPSYVLHASLTLHHNPSSNAQGHSGENTAVLQRIISPWDETSVTWGNQPVTTPVHQVTLPVSMGAQQDYDNINVTDLIRDIIDNQNNSYGLMLKLAQEENFRRLDFASSDHPDESARPVLEVCYTLGTSVETIDVTSLQITPNPFTDQFCIETPTGVKEYLVYDMVGKLHHRITTDPLQTMHCTNQLAGLAEGQYIIYAFGSDIRYSGIMQKAK